MITTSLKGRLFLVLVTATVLVWASASVWIFYQTRSQVERVLDTRLQEAARMVSSLTSANPSIAAGEGLTSSEGGTTYDRQLSCQIWSLDGRLVARSSQAPEDSLSPLRDGFSDQMVNGERWRVYAVSDAIKNIRILVGDRLGLRERLVADLIRGLLWPTVLIIPLLGMLTWSILGRGLRPLLTMANELRGRSVEDLNDLDTFGRPPELVPLINSLNNLFARVAAARQHERDFTAFAAHELRTPIAGLKIQAQVALATEAPGGREIALNNIVVSVDRTSRLIRQLLAMSRVDSASSIAGEDAVELGRLIADIVASVPVRSSMRIELSANPDGIWITTNHDLLATAFRNLYENAVNHVSSSGKITCTATSIDGLITISVEDDGPGISEDELDNVRKRFYRGRHDSHPGSGLGLAIVETALNRIGGRLHLENRGDGAGLCATMSINVAEARNR